MSLSLERPFWDLSEPDMEALAQSGDAGPPIPAEYRQAVAENLIILLGHARIMAAALAAAGPVTPLDRFEP